MQKQATASGWDAGFAADTSTSWLKSVPSGRRTFVNYLQTTYTSPRAKAIVLSEFGFADPGSNVSLMLTDAVSNQVRVDYFAGYLNALLEAGMEDGVNVTGTVAWGVFDTFECASGLRTRLGLKNVNSATSERTPKASVFTFVDFFRQHGL